MPKRSTTASIDFREPGGPDPADGLFVTPVRPRNSNAAAGSSRPAGAMPPPLPRRRAPSATPNALPAQRPVAPPQPIGARPVFDTSDDDDDAETQFDSDLAARFAATAAARFSGPASRFAAAVPTVIVPLEATPMPTPIAPAPPLARQAMSPQPILPHYAYPSPAPLPPEPTVPVPRAAFDVPTAPEAALFPAQFDAPMATERVDALTPPHMMAPVGALPADIDVRARPALTAFAFCSVAIAIGVIAGFVAMRGRSDASAKPAAVAASAPSAPSAPTRRAAPTVSAVTPSQAIAAAIDHPMDIVPPSPVAAAAASPTVTATGDAIGWKPRTVQPTISVQPAITAAPVVAAPVVATPVVAAPVVAAVEPTAAAIEPEMAAPARVIAPTRSAKRTARRASAPKQVAVAAPAPKAVVTKPAAKAAPKAVAAKAVATDKRRGSVDPIEAALAESPKTGAKGDGPGKVTVTSTPVALIYVDGRSTNMMTPKTLTLAPGSHKITLLEMSSRKAKTQDIDVPAGGALSLAKKF